MLLAALALPVTAGLSGCKIISMEEDQAMRERRSAAFDASRYVERLWNLEAKPHWAEMERPVGLLLGALKADFGATGESRGRQAGEGSPWTFVVGGEGLVTSIEAAPRGRLVVELPEGTVMVQVGPAVSGSALRDSLPQIHFNDFSNQLMFADVGRALTAKALDQTGPALREIRPGDRVRFGGVLSILEADSPLVITPYRLERLTGEAGR